ncbi:MAG: tRNA (N6-threonylcarbamoyladenosine(37)-N6)-methyltransferase TrmO [Candidatus Zixiibacteriota bacterium]
MTIVFEPIGIIHTPFKKLKGIPIQPRFARNFSGTVDIKPELVEGLADLDGFSHIILIYYLHLSKAYSLKVIPYLDDTPRGVFATRAPRRPNQIGLSVVRLDKIEGATLFIRDVDIIDGTPLLDIKPYVPDFEPGEKFKMGWLEEKIDKNNGRS